MLYPTQFEIIPFLESGDYEESLGMGYSKIYLISEN